MPVLDAIFCHQNLRDLSGRKRFLQKPEGNFAEQIPSEFGGGFFFGGFLGLSPWKTKKTEEKTPTKNPEQNSNQNLGASRPKSTLQGSGLGKMICAKVSQRPLPYKPLPL